MGSCSLSVSSSPIKINTALIQHVPLLDHRFKEEPVLSTAVQSKAQIHAELNHGFIMH